MTDSASVTLLKLKKLKKTFLFLFLQAYKTGIPNKCFFLVGLMLDFIIKKQAKTGIDDFQIKQYRNVSVEVFTVK